MTDSNDVSSVLGTVSAANLQEARVLLGKIVNVQHKKASLGLDLGGTVQLIDHLGNPIGECSSIGEHIIS